MRKSPGSTSLDVARRRVRLVDEAALRRQPRGEGSSLAGVQDSVDVRLPRERALQPTMRPAASASAWAFARRCSTREASAAAADRSEDRAERDELTAETNATTRAPAARSTPPIATQSVG